MFERPSWRSGSGKETLTYFRKWSEDPRGGPEGVGRPSRRSGGSQKILSEVWKWSGDPPVSAEVVGDTPVGPEVVWRLSSRSGSGRETLQ